MTTFPEENQPTSTTEDNLEESFPAVDLGQTDKTLEPPVADLRTKEQQAQEELQISQDNTCDWRLSLKITNDEPNEIKAMRSAIANESLLTNLLPTMDNLERAIQSGIDAGASGALIEGVQLTHKQFWKPWGKLGVRQVSSTGEDFDPNIPPSRRSRRI